MLSYTMAYSGLKIHPHPVRACVCARAGAKSDNILQTHRHAWNFIAGS